MNYIDNGADVEMIDSRNNSTEKLAQMSIYPSNYGQGDRND